MKLIFTWIEAHQAIAEKLLGYRDNQLELIEILKQAGVDGFNDEDVEDNKVPLTEIDPFTFFSYIYKHGPLRNKLVLRKVCEVMNIAIEVKDICGVPSSDARNVWYFPYKHGRNNNEINRLWSFFERLLSNNILTNVL
ncbi:hypothetical protein [Segetibacter koreensis]|uniref:hypothetical protein n=1 Tax=Segetibacter koreensis TaxID=398037 RepID=UPI00037E9C42|nr:hypothetical protein [Segetibacter koreensis]